ncbi:sigma-70 family RNA polymerase sigma factor [Kaistia terrae]|uniref:Sigma-70 family RNA polymerase sigma factor n=1 Tax=Kaistia terrae TaxID=537017 RepID=A0ABW0PSI2_9HYPH|nr:sigma-70 family RNA polymerase sigma factor [Kaistia terrae]MCX5577731.1 sigma-70 family RNA polymerase sigma factor [Kaistia terrae]
MTPDQASDVFETHRRRLVRLGYRMLGGRAAAEDIVQDAWLRWSNTDQSAVTNVGAFLTRIVTRLCLDEMKSARARRELYVGSWLPEPILEPDEPGIDTDELTMTLMLALERLSPLERAAFLLHDVFGQPLDEIATTLGRDAPAVRQLASRARKHVQEARPRFPVAREDGDRIAQAFFSAAHTGDVTALRALLADDVVLHSDGGGKVFAFLRPIVGMDHVLRMYGGLYRKLGPDWTQFIRPAWIDGLPGYVSRERGAILQTTAFAIEGRKITAIYMMRNPDKLTHVDG